MQISGEKNGVKINLKIYVSLFEIQIRIFEKAGNIILT